MVGKNNHTDSAKQRHTALPKGHEILLNQPQAFIGGIWAMIATVVVFQAIYNDTVKAGYQRILGAFLGALISIIICTVFGYGIAQMICSIFLSLCAIKLIKIDATIRITATTAGVIAGHGLITSSLIPWVDGSIRFTTTSIGAGIAMIASYLIKAFLDSNTNPPPWFNYEQLLMHV